MRECRTSYSCQNSIQSPHSYFPAKPTPRPLYQSRTWSLSLLRSLQSVSQQGWLLWYPFLGLTVLLWVDAGVKYSKLMHGSSEFKVVAIVALALKTVEDSIETFQ